MASKDRAILHVDMNCFYASVEMAERPELRGRPVIVGGDEESRHGIVLTASYPAKRKGVKTGSALWEARLACPDAIVVPPRYGLYMRYSRLAREMYNQYTDLVEPFGLDECWLDVTDVVGHASARRAESLAREISNRVKSELGCTVSIGVSWNKIFAKFGSDYRKPDAMTSVTRENYRELVWPAKAGDLLYVGPATSRKLALMGIRTIGELACADEYAVRRLLGKPGQVVQTFARGLDDSPVRTYEPGLGDIAHVVKGVGTRLRPSRSCGSWGSRWRSVFGLWDSPLEPLPRGGVTLRPWCRAPVRRRSTGPPSLRGRSVRWRRTCSWPTGTSHTGRS